MPDLQRRLVVLGRLAHVVQGIVIATEIKICLGNAFLIVYGLKERQRFLCGLKSEVMAGRVLFFTELEQLLSSTFGVRICGRGGHPRGQMPTEDQDNEA